MAIVTAVRRPDSVPLLRMTTAFDALLREHHAFVPTDNPFQRRARLLQSLWRERMGLPI